MLEFFKKKSQRKKLDRKILRKNDISILILDERWNGLFKNTQKTPEIVACEEKIKELMKEEARLIAESKDISQRKKVYMDKIIKLTPDAFDKNSEDAKEEMRNCEREIKQINERLPKIEEELDELPDRIKNANLELLEQTINVVYFKIRESQKRVKELDELIEDARNKLKLYIDEKEALSQDDTDIYSYFHDLLGGDELERLDKEHFGE